MALTQLTGGVFGTKGGAVPSVCWVSQARADLHITEAHWTFALSNVKMARRPLGI